MPWGLSSVWRPKGSNEGVSQPKATIQINNTSPYHRAGPRLRTYSNSQTSHLDRTGICWFSFLFKNTLLNKRIHMFFVVVLFFEMMERQIKQRLNQWGNLEMPREDKLHRYHVLKELHAIWTLWIQQFESQKSIQFREKNIIQKKLPEKISNTTGEKIHPHSFLRCMSSTSKKTCVCANFAASFSF